MMTLDEEMHEIAIGSIDAVARKETLKIITWVQDKYAHRTGLMVVLGYAPEHAENVLQLKEDRVKGMDVNVRDLAAYTVFATMAEHNDDGAVLVGGSGEIVKSGVHLSYNLRKYLAENKIIIRGTLGRSIGFVHDIGERHLSAIASSYFMPGTEIYILSHETNHLRGFRGGKIIMSPYEEELKGNSC